MVGLREVPNRIPYIIMTGMHTKSLIYTNTTNSQQDMWEQILFNSYP